MMRAMDRRKGLYRMKNAKSGLMIVVASTLAIVVTGCSTVEPQAPMVATVRGHDSNDHCDWTFEIGSGGKVRPGSIKPTPKIAGETCGTYETTQPLVIGETGKLKKVLDVTKPGEFVTEGDSCRYCYFNTAGGISCVTYPC
jgi:hypothetical protein